MQWKITEHKAPKTQQDIKVAIIVKQLAAFTWATYADAFERVFKEDIAEIKRTNNFSAEYMYKVLKPNQKQVEIWKQTVTGELKYKMFTLDFFGA